MVSQRVYEIQAFLQLSCFLNNLTFGAAASVGHERKDQKNQGINNEPTDQNDDGLFASVKGFEAQRGLDIEMPLTTIHIHHVRRLEHGSRVVIVATGFIEFTVQAGFTVRNPKVNKPVDVGERAFHQFRHDEGCVNQPAEQ